MSDKLDKILAQQSNVLVNQARMEEKLDNAIKVQESHSKDIKALNKFRWGIVGTGVFSVGALIKSCFGFDS